VILRPLSLEGPCLEVPQVTNSVVSRDGRLRWEVATHVVPGLDLDGCGSPVVIVPSSLSGLCPETLEWQMYLMRGECGYFVGSIEGLQDPFVLPGWSHGLRNIGAMQPSQVPADHRHGQVMTRYVFDGRIYRSGKREAR